MSAFVDKKSRSVIPRWRTFKATAALGELRALRQRNIPLKGSEESFSSKLEDWKAHPTIWHAADLFSAGLALGRDDVPREALDLLASGGSAVPAPAMAIARNIMMPKPAGAAGTELVTDVCPLDPRTIIHQLRRLLLSQPRNALMWVDLGLAYTIVGAQEKAERAIRTALSLQPDNRFVLRSASRFYVHRGDLRTAHCLLAHSPATSTDPWLVAAEIAVSTAGHFSPRLAKRGSEFLQGATVPPHGTTELASALATLELEAGKHRVARKLFRVSLLDPTENSVAQAEWASPIVGGLSVDPNGIVAPRLFEARAWSGFAKGRWEPALENSRRWLADQPFSSRPAALASYLAATIFEQHERAERILHEGLVANPTDPVLLNNLAFSYASRGNVEGAEAVIGRVGDVGTGPVGIILSATRGLIRFRNDDAAEGRMLYLRAIDQATKLGNSRLRALASIYLAREESRLGSQFARQDVTRALRESKSCGTPDILALAEHLSSLA